MLKISQLPPRAQDIPPTAEEILYPPRKSEYDYTKPEPYDDVGEFWIVTEPVSVYDPMSFRPKSMCRKTTQDEPLALLGRE